MDRRRLLASACALATLAAAVPLRATPEPVGWYRLPPGCAPAAGGELMQAMPCGGFGRYLLGREAPFSPPDCAGARHGFEVPAGYPASADAPAGGAAVPCVDGSCFDGRPGGPWVAVVDWDDPHGWTVGETILQASDRRARVALYDLEEPGATFPEWLEGVGDAHVLAQLCAVAERIAGGDDPPLTLNLSFGRLPRGGQVACPISGEGSLECELRAVLGWLGDEHGVVPVAAGGNHGLLLFPAADAGVVAAGALDLARYALDGAPRPSRETPAGAEGLVPGYGLYLESTGEPNGYWPAPPGSSYAAAVLSGWIAGTLDAHPAPLPPRGSWAPLLDGERWALARDGSALPGSDLAGPTELLAAALGARPAVCNGGMGGATVVLEAAEGAPPALPDKSLAELTARGNEQLPGSVICVPCHGGPEVPLAGELSTSPLRFEVDLHRGGPLASEYQLTGLYLRLGDTLLPLDRSHDLALLYDLAQGELAILAFEGLPDVPDGTQISLVYTLRYGTTAFWHAEPVHAHEHP